MSKVFNMVGGGGKNISSIVITGLESTDTVTCTKDGKSYNATWDATDKRFEITGLPLGTFTVTATNGTKTITKTVLIDISGVYNIEIYLTLWLYNNGDEFVNTTGGFVTGKMNSGGNTSGSVSINTNDIYLYGTWRIGSNGSYGYVYTKYKIDLSDYTKLVIEATTNINDASADIHAINISDSVDGNTYTTTSYNEFKSGHMEFDLSSFDDAKFITIGFYGTKSSTTVTSSANITKIWLE